MNIDEWLRIADSWRHTDAPPGELIRALADEVERLRVELEQAHSSHRAVVDGMFREVERLRAIEARAQAASVAGVDAIVRDAALHILNYGG